IPTLRSGIAEILSTIPQILSVDDTAYPGEANVNLPFAQIHRGPVQMHNLTLAGEEADTQLGAYDYLITWTIRVYSAFRNLRDAQQADDLLAMSVQEAFNSNRLINGLVDNSRVTLITPSLQDDARPKLWVSTITLQTLTI